LGTHVADILGFLIGVGVRMLDRITLVLAAVIGWAASNQKQAIFRWLLIGVGASAVTAAVLVLVGRPPTMTRVLAALTAGFLQIAIAGELCRWLWREKSA